MELNSANFEKVKSLLKIPINHVEYAGCWSSSTISFVVGTENKQGNLISGVHLTISYDFEIVRLDRLKTTWGPNTRKTPTVTELLPLHPAGQIPSIYKHS